MTPLLIGGIVVAVIVIIGVIAYAATRKSATRIPTGPAGCASDLDCDDLSAPACDVVTGTCRPCVAQNDTDTHCPADRPYCTNFECRYCLEDKGCAPGLLCDSGDSCKVCRGAADCTSPGLPRCLPDGSSCAECFRPQRSGFTAKRAASGSKKATLAAIVRAGASSTGTAYCKTDPDRRFCDEATHTCVGCRDPGDCGDLPICEKGVCKACTGDATGCPPGRFCAADQSQCVVCRGDLDCPKNAPRCNASGTACTEC